MLASPSAEGLKAFNERLAAAYAAVEAVKTDIDFARDAVEEARDEARSYSARPRRRASSPTS